MIGSFEEYQEVLALLNARNVDQPERKLHRLPLERYSLSDCDFFFTICARHQGTPFTDAKLAQEIIDALLWRKEKHNWWLYCYCLMPDHLHFVTRFPEREIRLIDGGARGLLPESVLDHVAQYKSYTTNQIWWKCGGTGALWQRSSYDRVIRYDDSVENAAIYALNNPVRKGLVENWNDYPYSAIVDSWT